MYRFIKQFRLFICVFVLFSCNDSQNPLAYQKDTHSRGETEVFVEESYKPLFETSIYTFEGQFPKAKVHPKYCTEKEAIEGFLNKKTKTIFISRDFTTEEKAKLKLSQVVVKSDVVAKDAVALIVHPNNLDTTMSLPKLKNILTGKDSLWKNSKAIINIVFDNQNSANFSYLKELIKNEDFGIHVFAVKSNEEVIKYVKSHPNSLGVIGVNWISDEDDTAVLSFLKGIKVIALSKNENGECFKPYQSYIYTKQYPLTRELWSINSARLQGLNSGFVFFMLGEKGQLIVHKSSLVSATAPIRMIEIKTE